LQSENKLAGVGDAGMHETAGQGVHDWQQPPHTTRDFRHGTDLSAVPTSFPAQFDSASFGSLGLAGGLGAAVIACGLKTSGASLFLLPLSWFVIGRGLLRCRLRFSSSNELPQPHTTRSEQIVRGWKLGCGPPLLLLPSSIAYGVPGLPPLSEKPVPHGKVPPLCGKSTAACVARAVPAPEC